MIAPSTLKSVPWLSSLGDRDLGRLARRSRERTFAPGAPLLVELEVGESVFILLQGRARVSVVAAGGVRREIGMLGPGDTCGELSLVTRELTSATVTAESLVVALEVVRSEFRQLTARHPELLAHLAPQIARRVTDMDRALNALFASDGEAPAATDDLAGRASAVISSRGALARAWRELVVSRGRELPLLALAAFTGTLLLLRGATFALEAAGLGFFEVLRAFYLSGMVLVFASTALSLARFRSRLQRRVALVHGVGFALILNELSVFLAFDTFFLDMTTPDPALVFSAEALYRRSESLWAVLIMTAFLAQLTLLRPFYRRVAFALRARRPSPRKP